MSTTTGTAQGTGGATRSPAALPSVFRLAALASVLVLTVSYLSVLHFVTTVVGGKGEFLPLVVGTLVAATVLASVLRDWMAALLALGLLVAGYVYYLLLTPVSMGVLLANIGTLVADAIALLTGLSVLRMTQASVWALGFAPAPVFLSWFLALRGRYVLASLVGGAALGVLVLTGDAGLLVTLSGTLGGIAAIGFGELNRRGGTLVQADTIAIVVAAVTVVSLTLTVVPGGVASPVMLPGSGGSDGNTLDATLTSAPDQTTIQGSISLSPEVRFVVRSDRPLYWRAGTYDRFTGQSWVRSGSTRPYDGRLQGPPGPTDTVTQTVTVKARGEVMPAAAEPVVIRGDAAEHTLVTDQGHVQPDTTLIPGDRYGVESQVVTASADELRTAGTDYPDEIEQRYTQVPDSVSGTFRERTAAIVADADTPYETALVVEEYLESNKDYSLEVDRPDGNVAEGFLLGMQAGYCTYFATTMVTMLRAEGVPARYVVGYTTGQQVDDNEWVVRGLDSHAWVEVYFPEIGWVRFDPTPAGPRRAAEVSRVEEARASDERGVDVAESENADLEPPELGQGAFNGSNAEPPAGEVTNDTRPGDIPGVGENATPTNETVGGGGASGVPLFPSGRDALLGAMLVIGLAAGAHRSGMTDRAYREARMRWQGKRSSPRDDVERAYERLELLLEKRYRPREPGETPRQYLDALTERSFTGRTIDSRIERVAHLYERGRYADDLGAEEADEAVRLVDELVNERSAIAGLFRR